MMRRKLIVSVLIMTAVILLPLSAQGKETLAVLDFTTEAVSKTEMGAIVEFLSAELFNTDKYIVIDVSQREAILQEMEFSLSGCSDDSCALEIGKMLSAEMIVTGNLSKVGSRYLMSVKMLETETSRTMGTANGKYTNLDDLIDGLETIAFTLAGMEEDIKVAEKTPEQKPEEKVEPAVTETAESDISTDDGGAAQTASEGSGSAVPAIVCTASGIAAMGVGGYFLFNLFTNSLPAYNNARDVYSSAYGDADYSALYEQSENYYDEAMFDLIIGASVAGVGVALTVVGILLFPPAAEEDGATVSFAPVIYNTPGMVVRVSY